MRYILISFFLCGISDTTWKMAGEVNGSAVNSYLLLFHIFALMASLITFFAKNQKITKKEFILGSIVGFTLIAGGICSLKALLILPGIVFFPIASCASLLLVTVLASIFWKEKPTTRQIYGLIVAFISIFLIAL